MTLIYKRTIIPINIIENLFKKYKSIPDKLSFVSNLIKENHSPEALTCCELLLIDIEVKFDRELSESLQDIPHRIQQMKETLIIKSSTTSSPSTSRKRATRPDEDVTMRPTAQRRLQNSAEPRFFTSSNPLDLCVQVLHQYLCVTLFNSPHPCAETAAHFLPLMKPLLKHCAEDKKVEIARQIAELYSDPRYGLNHLQEAHTYLQNLNNKRQRGEAIQSVSFSDSSQDLRLFIDAIFSILRTTIEKEDLPKEIIEKHLITMSFLLKNGALDQKIAIAITMSQIYYYAQYHIKDFRLAEWYCRLAIDCYRGLHGESAVIPAELDHYHHMVLVSMDIKDTYRLLIGDD